MVPSRFPPVDLFERIADPKDWEVLAALESLTNDRLRQEIGNLSLVPVSERRSGPGSTPIMAAFTHCNPDGSRFTDGSYGVYYAAKSLETAIAETRYHRERFLAATTQPAISLAMRVYCSDLAGDLIDLRNPAEQDAAIFDLYDYRAAQRLALDLRQSGVEGLVYGSVRHSGGDCAAVFRPHILGPARQERHLAYHWDGQRISHVTETA